MTEMTEARKRARAATLGAPSDAFKTIGLRIGDELFALREPTVREHGQIMKAAASEAAITGKTEVSIDKLRVAAVVKCAYTAEQLLDGDGKPLVETVPLLDAQDKPVLGADGQPKTEERPVVKALERVFDDADTEAMLDQPVSGFVGKLAAPALRLVNAKVEDARKSG